SPSGAAWPHSASGEPAKPAAGALTAPAAPVSPYRRELSTLFQIGPPWHFRRRLRPPFGILAGLPAAPTLPPRPHAARLPPQPFCPGISRRPRFMDAERPHQTGIVEKVAVGA